MGLAKKKSSKHKGREVERSGRRQRRIEEKEEEEEEKEGNS